MKIITNVKYCNKTGRKLSNAIIECNHCKSQIELSDSWSNSCDNCGTEYNGSGQELADRSQWGYETGEHPSDFYDM